MVQENKLIELCKVFGLSPELTDNKPTFCWWQNVIKRLESSC